MDPRTNPYAPGAGTVPPELAGRDMINLRDMAELGPGTHRGRRYNG